MKVDYCIDGCYQVCRITKTFVCPFNRTPQGEWTPNKPKFPNKNNKTNERDSDTSNPSKR